MHAKYGFKINIDREDKNPHFIEFDINPYTHRHTIHERREEEAQPYGQDLVAIPFWDPLLSVTNDEDLSPFHPMNPDHRAINIAITGLGDPGVTADIDRFRALCLEEELLKRQEHEIKQA